MAENSIPKIIFRWVIVLGTLMAIGPFVGSLIRGLHDRDGGHAFTLLVNDAPMKGAALGLLTFVVAGVLAIIAASSFALGTGLACAGFITGWAAWQLGTADGIIRRAGAGDDLFTLGLEGFICCIASCVIAHICSNIAAKRQPKGNRPEVVPGAAGLFFTQAPMGGMAPALVASVLGAAAGAALLTGLIAVTALKGQTLLAAFFGAIAAGLVACYVAAVFKGTPRAVVPMLGVALVALAGPMIAKVMHGAGIVEALYAGKLFVLARPVSLDWAAGALLGVPIGMSWAGVVLDVRGVEQMAGA